MKPVHRFIVYLRLAAVTAIATLAAACAKPTATAIPTLTPEPSETAALVPTATATAAPSDTPTPTAVPSPTPASPALRDLAPGETLAMLTEIPVIDMDFGVRSVFSPDEPILYHTGVGPQIKGYDFELGHTVFELSEFPSGSPLYMAVSPDGKVIVAEDGPSLGVWSLPEGQRLASLQMPSIFAPANAGFLDAGAFYACDPRGNVTLWDAADWQEIDHLSFPGPVDAAFMLPSTEAVVMLLQDEAELKIVDQLGLLQRTVPLPAMPFRFVAISPQGDRALLHVDYGKPSEGILVIDLQDGRSALTIPLLNLRALAVSDDWRTLAVTDVNEQLHLLDPQTGAEFYSQPLQVFQVMGLSLAGDGSLLAVHARNEGSSQGTIQIWGRELP